MEEESFEFEFAFRYVLAPNQSQRQALASHTGASRYAFNWALSKVKENLTLRATELEKQGAAITPLLVWHLYSLLKLWNQEKEQVAPWWQTNSKEAYNSGIANAVAALNNWSTSQKGLRKGPPMGFPKFKKKCQQSSCTFTTGAIKVKDVRHVVLPRLGTLKTHEDTTKLDKVLAKMFLKDTSGVIKVDEQGNSRLKTPRATISCQAGDWYVSFGVSAERNISKTQTKARLGNSSIVGVDLGVKTLATLSTGEVIVGPKALPKRSRKLKRLQRVISRRRKGSANHRKAVARLAQAHHHVASIRRDCLNKLTSSLAKEYETVVIEDLAIKNMTKRPSKQEDPKNQEVFFANGATRKAGLNQAILDMGFGEFRRQLEYKSKWYQANLVLTNTFYPSSKRCSSCGQVKPSLSLEERTYHCEGCGLSMDRDLNAAVNLALWAEEANKTVAGSASETLNACGEKTHESTDSLLVPVRGEAGTGTGPEPSVVTEVLNSGHEQVLPI